MKNATPTDLLQIADEDSFPVLSEDDKQVESTEELGEAPIQRTSSNKKRGHPSLVNRQDFIGIKSLIDELKNSRETHDHRFGLGEGVPKRLKDRQGQHEIAQGTLVNHQHRPNLKGSYRS